MIWKKTKKPVSEEEPFISLVQLAREDAEVGSMMKTILSMESFHRKSMLNTWIEHLRLKGGSRKLLAALLPLLDDEVADKAHEIICQDNEYR